MQNSYILKVNTHYWDFTFKGHVYVSVTPTNPFCVGVCKIIKQNIKQDDNCYVWDKEMDATEQVKIESG